MGTVPRSPNRLLANLTPADHERVRPHFHDLELLHAEVLVAAGDEIKDAYFPHSGARGQHSSVRDERDTGLRYGDGMRPEIAVVGCMASSKLLESSAVKRRAVSSALYRE